MNGVIDTLNFTNSNNEISNLYPRTLVEAITNKQGETLESILQKINNASGSTGNTESVNTSDDKFSINFNQALDTGWYQIGNICGIYSCNINIMEFGQLEGIDKTYTMQADILSNEMLGLVDTDVKILNCITSHPDVPYVGFDKIAVVSDESDMLMRLVVHYTNPGYMHYLGTMTISNNSCGEVAESEVIMSTKVLPCDDGIIYLGEDSFEEDYTIKTERDIKLEPNSSGTGSGDSHQFSISGKNLETGVYRIFGIVSIMSACLIHIVDSGVNSNDGSSGRMSATYLFDVYATEAPKLKALECNTVLRDMDKYIGFDKWTALPNGNTMDITFHYTNPGYTEQECHITITPIVSGMYTVSDDFTTDISVLPCGDKLIPETEIEIPDNEWIGTLDINGDAAKSNDDVVRQYTVSTSEMLPGWYRIGENSMMQMGDCNIHIYDMSDASEQTSEYMSCNLLYNVAGYNSADMSTIGTMKVTSCDVTDNYVGFDKLRISIDMEQRISYLDIHYSGETEGNYTHITVENTSPMINGMGYGLQAYYKPINFVSVEDELPTNLMPLNSCDLQFVNAAPATTADLLALKTELLGLIDEISALVGGE